MTSEQPRAVMVLDASVGIRIIRRETGWQEAFELLRGHMARGGRCVVPALFWLEVVNVLGRRYGLGPDVLLGSLAELEAAGIETTELDRPMLLLALDAVVRHGLTAYDATYLALADAADAELLTADAELAAAAGAAGIRARLVGPRRIGESRASYAAAGSRARSWADWPGAAAYLADLRARLTTPA